MTNIELVKGCRDEGTFCLKNNRKTRSYITY